MQDVYTQHLPPMHADDFDHLTARLPVGASSIEVTARIAPLLTADEVEAAIVRIAAQMRERLTRARTLGEPTGDVYDEFAGARSSREMLGGRWSG